MTPTEKLIDYKNRTGVQFKFIAKHYFGIQFNSLSVKMKKNYWTKSEETVIDLICKQ